MSSGERNYDHLFKLLLVGSSGVGKSSLLLQFTSNSFRDDVESTIGVDFKVKYVDLENKKCKLTVWDTAGAEKFRSLTSSYYRGAHGVILTYDVTDHKSFEDVQMWLKEIDQYSTYPDVVRMLVGNKIDLENMRKVSTEEGKAFAKQQRMMFIESSAKTKQGVSQAFDELVRKILQTPSLTNGGEGGVQFGQRIGDEKGACGCFGF